jgi:hypothetical protein
MAIAEQLVVADAVETGRQDVQEEAADEFRRLQGHRFLAVGSIGAVVRVAEGDVAVLDGEQPLVGDRHAMGVAPDVVEDLVRAAKQRQSILPIVTEKRLSSTTRIIL